MMSFGGPSRKNSRGQLWSVPIDGCTWLCLLLTYRLTFLTLRIGVTVHLLVLQPVFGRRGGLKSQILDNRKPEFPGFWGDRSRTDGKRPTARQLAVAARPLRARSQIRKEV